MLKMVQGSVAWEVEAHARRQQRHGGHGGRQEGSNGNGRNQKGAVMGWRDVRHACFRVPRAALAARREEEEGGGQEEGEEAKDSNGDGHGGGVGPSEEGAAAAVVVDEEAVAAEWEDEMVVAAAAAGEWDGSSGVREAEVEKAQRMSRMLKSARAWNWLTETEELSIQMREGRLFCGFQVGGCFAKGAFYMSTAPRRTPNADNQFHSTTTTTGANAALPALLQVERGRRRPELPRPELVSHEPDLCPPFKSTPESHTPILQPPNPNRLDSLYKVSKEGKKTGIRPPSYTDRVLVHSLPDERQRLRLKAVR